MKTVKPKLLLVLALFFLNGMVKGQIPNYLPSDALVGWYPFNGNANDQSGLNNNGVVTGVTLTTDRNNSLNSAYNFNGSARIVVPTPSTTANTPYLTINAWVNYGTTATTMLVTRRRWTDAVGEQFSFDTKAFHVKKNSSCSAGIGWQSMNFLTTPTLNQWAMLTVTFDGTTMRQYLNGNLVTSFQPSGNSQPIDGCSGGDIIFGATWATHPFYFTGKIDDIAIFNRALSAIEISRIFNECGKFVSLQPISQTAVERANVQLVTNTNLSNVNYQWQIKQGTSYVNLANDAYFSGVNTRFLNISGVHYDLHLAKFRCILNRSGLCLDTTNEATLTVNKLIVKNIPKWLPDSNLVAWYPFNGNANDESGNGNNGIVYGAILTTDRLNQNSKAYNFSGNNSRIKIPYSNTLKTPLITINAWVRRSNSTLSGLITKRDWTSSQNEQYSFDSKDFYIKRASNCQINSGWSTLTYTTPPPINEWDFVSLSFDGRFIKHYRNGNLSSTVDLLTTQNMDTCLGAELTFGAIWKDFPYWFNGKLDDISIYSRALSQEEIKQIFNECDATLISSIGSPSSFLEDSSYVIKLNLSDTLISQTNWQMANDSNWSFITDTSIFTGFNSTLLGIKNVNYELNGLKIRAIVTAIEGCKDTSDVILINVQKRIIKNIPYFLKDSGLVAWYPFNGNAYDESGNGNNGIVKGPILAADRFGNQAKSYFFDGVNDRIKIPYSTSLKTPLITINAWVKKKSSNVQALISKRDWKTAQNEQYSFDTKDFYVKRNSGCLPNIGWNSIPLTMSPELEKWAMITVSYDGKFLKVYENAKLVNSKDIGINQIMDTCLGAEISFGANWESAAAWFFGNLDDISIYSRSLSFAEIQMMYDQCGNNLVSISPTDKVVKQGSSVQLSTESILINSSYQWEVSVNGGLSYSLIKNDSITNGAQSKIITINPIGLQYDGSKFRCIITSPRGCKDTTDFCTLIVEPVIKNIPFYLPDSALVAFYPFNGNAYDESGNGNNGIVLGPVLTQDRLNNNNMAYSYSGNNNRIKIPYSQSLKTQLLSINCWVKPSSNNSMQIISKRDWTTANNEQYSLDNKDFYIKRGTYCLPNDGWQSLTNYNGITSNIWKMLTVTYDGFFMKTYINGSLISTKTFSSFMTLDTCLGAEISIGAGWQTNPFYFNGVIDDISIYSRAISSVEVLQIYTQCVKHITVQPEIIENVNLFDTLILTAQTRFPFGAQYRWQIKSGLDFIDILPSSNYSGINNASLMLLNTPMAFNNNIYRCIITPSNTCSDTTRHSVVKVNLPGSLLENNKIELINVYPNPNDGLFLVRFPAPIEGDLVVNIFDFKGRVVEMVEVNLKGEKSLNLNTTNLSNGVYFLQIQFKEGNYFSRFIIQK